MSSAPVVPPEVIQAAKPVLAWLLLVYLLYPFMMFATTLRRSLPMRLASFLLGSVVIYLLATDLQGAMGVYFDHKLNILWGSFALLLIKHIHAVFEPNFEEQLGLTSFRRLLLFFYMPVTIIFVDEGSGMVEKTTECSRNTRINGLLIIFRGLAQIVLFVAIGVFVLNFHLASRLPEWVHPILLLYMMTLSFGGHSDLFFNGPSRLLLGGNKNIMIIDTANVPAMTTNARFIWHRWSKNAGYHFRKAIYDRMGGTRNNLLLPTAATFAVNCIFHIFWWGPVTIKRLAWEYTQLLIVAPMTALAMDMLLRALFKKRSIIYEISSYVLFLVLGSVAITTLLQSMGLPHKLDTFTLLLKEQLNL